MRHAASFRVEDSPVDRCAYTKTLLLVAAVKKLRLREHSPNICRTQQSPFLVSVAAGTVSISSSTATLVATDKHEHLVPCHSPLSQARHRPFPRPSFWCTLSLPQPQPLFSSPSLFRSRSHLPYLPRFPSRSHPPLSSLRASSGILTHSWKAEGVASRFRRERSLSSEELACAPQETAAHPSSWPQKRISPDSTRRS